MKQSEDFRNQPEIIEPVWLEATLLGIHVFSFQITCRGTPPRGTILGPSTVEGKHEKQQKREEKSLAASRIQTHDL